MQLRKIRRILTQSTSLLQQFANDKRGNVAVIFGITSIPLAMIASMSVDFGNSVRIQNELQAAVDAGVLAAATAMASGEDDTSKTQIAEDTFFANLSDNSLSGFSASPVTNVDFPGKQVTMTVSVTNSRMLTTLLSDHIDINVEATAVVDPGNPICMMSLNPTAKEALYLNGTADIVADGCSIHVNSGHDEALRQVGSGTALAESFCVHGEYSGSNYTPTPEKDCRVEQDPLKEYFNDDWSTVDYSVCDFQSSDIFGQGNGAPDVVLLEPGVYCGDLNITAGKTAILQSDGGDNSVYVFVDGSIDIRGGGTLRNTIEAGDGVTGAPGMTFPAETAIILTGANPGRLEVNGGADMVIKAKSSGTFAGIAVAQDPNSIPSQPHQIAGGGNVNIDGIVYLPTQPLDVTGNGVIGNEADQFAIIADVVEVDGTGQLEIRIGADYQAAGLPELPQSHERVRLAN